MVAIIFKILFSLNFSWLFPDLKHKSSFAWLFPDFDSFSWNSLTFFIKYIFPWLFHDFQASGRPVIDKTVTNNMQIYIQ